MPRTKQDMVIAVCPVVPAHAIPDQGRWEIWSGRRELALPWPEKSYLRAVPNLPERHLDQPNVTVGKGKL
jgi:hypothetical protein